MKKLLVIEDHKFYQKILPNILCEYEFAIYASLSQVPKPLDYYDLILTDGNHGDGVIAGGVAVVKQSGDTPVVAMSTRQEYLDAMLEAGAAGSYHKETSPKLLLAALSAAA